MKSLSTNVSYFICVTTLGCLLITLKGTNAMVNPILRPSSQQAGPDKPDLKPITSVSADAANALVESGAKPADIVSSSQIAPGSVIGVNEISKLEIDVHEMIAQPLKPQPVKRRKVPKKLIRLEGDLSKRGNADGHHVSTEEESSEEIKSNLHKSIIESAKPSTSLPEQTSTTTTTPNIDTNVDETITAPGTTTTLAPVPMLSSDTPESSKVLPLMPTTTTSMDIVTTRRLSLMDEIKKTRESMNNPRCPNFTEFIQKHKDSWGELKDASGIKARLGVVVDSTKNTFQSIGHCMAEILARLESYFKGKKGSHTENGVKNQHHGKEKPVLLT